DGLAEAHGARPLLGSPEEEAGAHPRLGQRGARPGLPHRRAGAGMSRVIQDATACREALARLPELDLGELRQQWRTLYKTEASPHLSRELLLRAVAYRMQELALGGLRPERQRQLRQFAQQLKESGATRIRPRPELQPGTRLVREWQRRSYEVLVLDDGFSWQGAALGWGGGGGAKDRGRGGVGSALLGVEGEPVRKGVLLATAGSSRHADGLRQCRGVTRAASVARSTPANPLRRGSSRSSTHW